MGECLSIKVVPGTRRTFGFDEERLHLEVPEWLEGDGIVVVQR